MYVFMQWLKSHWNSKAKNLHLELSTSLRLEGTDYLTWKIIDHKIIISWMFCFLKGKT